MGSVRLEGKMRGWGAGQSTSKINKILTRDAERSGSWRASRSSVPCAPPATVLSAHPCPRGCSSLALHAAWYSSLLALHPACPCRAAQNGVHRHCQEK